MNMGLSGKVAIITGGAQGIGFAIAAGFVAEGARTVILDINATKAREAAKKLGILCTWHQLDVSDPKACEEVINLIGREMGGIHILVNNAGVCQSKRFEELSLEDWERLLRVNLSGAFYCIKAALPYFLAQKWGRIINISSLAGKSGGLLVSANYSASKAGLLGLTKALARELAPYGVTVNAVAPGTTETELISSWPNEQIQSLRQAIPLGRLAHPEDIAAAVLFLASEQASFITGEVLDVNGGQFID